MPNIGGLCQWKQKLISTVVYSQLLYAAPVLALTAVRAASNRTSLITPQRTMALRAIRAYRTVYDEASLLLADMPSMDLFSAGRW